MRLRASYGEIELIYMERRIAKDANPRGLFKCGICRHHHPYLFRIWRRPAGVLNGQVQFRYCGETHTPDLNIPIIVEKLPRGSRVIVQEEMEIFWHTATVMHCYNKEGTSLSILRPSPLKRRTAIRWRR